MHICQAIYDYDYSRECQIGDNLNVDHVLLQKMHHREKSNFDSNFSPGNFKIIGEIKYDQKDGTKIIRVYPDKLK